MDSQRLSRTTHRQSPLTDTSPPDVDVNDPSSHHVAGDVWLSFV